ncbi:Niemann-Pick C1-like protein 1 [Aix galericulata]|nr:Niemann-Pick C1-like protein 1 [Aix galericulata]
MPAVRTFALTASVAIAFDFLLQMSGFVALLALDARRQEVLLFLFFSFAGLYLTLHVSVGLDQEIAMPEVTPGGQRHVVTTGCPGTGTRGDGMAARTALCGDSTGRAWPCMGRAQPNDSYMLQYFSDMNQYLPVGVPTYFVTTSGYNFSSTEGTNAICSSAGCDDNSLTQMIQYATRFPNVRHQLPAGAVPERHAAADGGGVRALPALVPPRPPHPAVRQGRPLRTSQEYTAALRAARALAENITGTLRQVPGTDPDFRVFPYTVTYVYYEQYLTVVGEGLFTLALCLVPTFLVSFVLLGMDLRSSVATLITITMILLDTVGIMALWDIPYNAVALINLVAAVGISVEFVSHLTCAFAHSTKPNRVERAAEATVTMGSKVGAARPRGHPRVLPVTRGCGEGTTRPR